MSVRSSLMFAVLLGLTACEPSHAPMASVNQPTPQELFLTAPDPGFRLAPEDRERVPRAVNLDALEALLAQVRPEYRHELLASVETLPRNGAIAFGPITSRVTDPHLISLFRKLIQSPAQPEGEDSSAH